METFPWYEALSVGILLLVMLTGLFGLIVPIFPGGVVIWLAGLVYGLINGFGTVGWIVFVLMTLLMIAIGVADNVLMGAKALGTGASWWGIGVGLLAGLVASLFLTPLGGIVAAPLGLFLVEYIRLKDYDKAIQVTKGLLIGWGWSFVARFSMGVVMLLLWGIWVWANA